MKGHRSALGGRPQHPSSPSALWPRDVVGGAAPLSPRRSPVLATLCQRRLRFVDDETEDAAGPTALPTWVQQRSPAARRRRGGDPSGRQAPPAPSGDSPFGGRRLWGSKHSPGGGRRASPDSPSAARRPPQTLPGCPRHRPEAVSTRQEGVSGGILAGAVTPLTAHLARLSSLAAQFFCVTLCTRRRNGLETPRAQPGRPDVDIGSSCLCSALHSGGGTPRALVRRRHSSEQQRRTF